MLNARLPRCPSVARALLLVLGAMLCSRLPAARAALAVVAATQHVTEMKASSATDWIPANPGTGLNINDDFRTGKRSKADIKINTLD